MTAPALFIGHGSPMNAITDSPFRRAWSSLGRTLPEHKAILCVSAHWETEGVAVTASKSPETIHDFYGFPKPLFAVRYQAPGSPALARRVAALLDSEEVVLDEHRGLDHGAWSVLVATHPVAAMPVLQLSLDRRKSYAQHYALARKLAPLRDEGVLILASGNIVHNLGLYDYSAKAPLDWAARFDAAVKNVILAGLDDSLADLSVLGVDAKLAVPTDEHFLPLLYALGVRREGESVEVFNESVLGSLSMTSYRFG